LHLVLVLYPHLFFPSVSGNGDITDNIRTDRHIAMSVKSVFSSSGLGASRHWLFNGVHVHITYAATLQHILYGVCFTVNVEVGLQCGRLALTD